MKKLIFAATLMLSFVMFTAFTTDNESNKYKHIVGTWEYIAADAPYEYSEGDLIFSVEKGKLVGIVDIQGYKMDLEDVKANGNTVQFFLNVEGEDLDIKMNFKGKTFKGTATFSQGTLPFEGKKVK